MSRRLLTTAACTALAASVLVATPAEAATYGVTLNLSKSTADVGQKIGLSGKVTGSKAAKKKLSVQYRLGSGSWKTVKTVTTSSKATYATTFTVKTAGTAGLRVVAPKSGSTKAGTSPARNFTGYRWLWLHQQKLIASGYVSVDDVSHQGKDYPHSIYLGTSSGILWGTRQKCDKLSASLAVPSWAGDVSSQTVSVSSSTSGTIQADQGDPKPIDQFLSSSADYLSISRGSGSGPSVMILSPKVHCSVNELPVAIL
ncbi:MAG: hypothetical protein PGN07_07705 [Aeromicrobium erythreum]